MKEKKGKGHTSLTVRLRKGTSIYPTLKKKSQDLALTINADNVKKKKSYEKTCIKM